jgi:glycosyltransferase involved in cell wall biosynthesis
MGENNGSKILFLITQDLESPYGLGRIFPLAKGLVRLGHQVTIAALHPDFSSLDRTRMSIEGVGVHYVSPMHVRKRGSEKSYYPAGRLVSLAATATFRLWEEARQIPADLIHIGKPHPMNGLAGVAGRLGRDTPLLLDCDDYEAGSGHFTGRWQRAGVALIERWLPHRVDRITTNTSYMRQRLSSWGVPDGKIVNLPNGVDLDRFRPADGNAIKHLRRALDLMDRRIVAFIGSLSRPSHPVDLLLRAFRRVIQTQPRAVLLIVGGGEDYPRLVKSAQGMDLQDRVRFCGRVAPEEVRLYYQLAEVSVDPVYDDPVARGRSPLKLFESWAMGVPFVSADVGDRAYLAGSPPAALLVQPGDPEALSQAILSVLDTPSLAASLRERGKERVRAFTWEILSKQVSDLYRTVIAGAHPWKQVD